MSRIRQLILDNIDESVASFCRNSGVNRTTVQQIIKGKYTQKLSNLSLKRICNYFGVDWKKYLED